VRHFAIVVFMHNDIDMYHVITENYKAAEDLANLAYPHAFDFEIQEV
jgi:hypothetical protein